MGTNLYRIALKGDATVWRYNDSARPVDAMGETWAPAVIRRDKRRVSMEDAEMKVFVADNLEPFTQFLAYNPDTVLSVEVREVSGKLIYRGRVMGGVYITKDRTIELRLSALVGANASPIPPRIFSPTCNAELGDSRCGVDLEDYKISFTESGTTFDGSTITNAAIGGESDGYWIAGFVRVGTEYRFVIDHEGNTITTLGPVRSQTGTFELFPGCDKSRGTCVAKFDNLTNFRGFTRIPGDNPTLDGIR